ncbi:MAG: response regulator [Nitrospinae bacterium]|nr:response regulator [Nitrospinota bacterium]
MGIEKKKKVLLAEDNDTTRYVMVEMLNAYDFDVIQAVDGEVAKRIYDEKHDEIDVIVSDLMMPNVTGVEFAKYNYSNEMLPFIMCTAVKDAQVSLELFEYGVQDYVVKPIDVDKFIGVVKNAIFRYSVHLMSDDPIQHSGNVSSITIPSAFEELTKAANWVRSKIEKRFDERTIKHFLCSMDEFLINAHEHGNLGINEEEKIQYIHQGQYKKELKRRESECKKTVKVTASVLKDEIAITISDEGEGFDYKKYLNMNEADIIKRFTLPCGRGIYMSRHYFDKIQYSNGGRKVLCIKKLQDETVHM